MVKDGYIQATVIVRSDTWKRLKVYAIEHDTAASEIINRLIEEFLGKATKPRK